MSAAADLARAYGLDLDRLTGRSRQRLDELAGRTPTAQAFIQAVTVQVSCFLRHPEQFEWLAQRAWAPRLRILSAGCAEGEEAYSLAAVLGPGREASVLGVDVCPDAIERARRAQYSRWSGRGLDVLPSWLQPRDKARLTIRDDVRERVRFAEHNLLLPVDGPFDLIVCRNVLIYLTPTAQRIVFAHLAKALSPQGVLLVAPGDPHPPRGSGLHPMPGTTWAFSRGLPAARTPTPIPQRRFIRPTSRPPAAPPPECPIELKVEQAAAALDAGAFDEALALARQITYHAPEAPFPAWLLCEALYGTGAPSAERRLRALHRQLDALDADTPLRFGGGLTAGALRAVLAARPTR